MNQIINIGVDTIEIDRVVRSCRRQYFLDHIFSEKEIEQMDSGKRRAASDFAGKEAVVKVLGTGFSQGVEACQIEILRHEDGSPYVVLHGRKNRTGSGNPAVENIHYQHKDGGYRVCTWSGSGWPAVWQKRGAAYIIRGLNRYERVI